MKEEKFYLTSTPIKNLLMKFAIPCILAMLVSALYNIVDQIFIGNSVAGTAGIMATTLVFPFTVVALALASLIGDGCASLYSISLGAKDKKTSNKCIGTALVSIIIISILLVVLGYVFMNPILNLLGIQGYNETCKEFTQSYYLIILAGIPFYMLASACSSIIRASGSPTYSMISTLVGALLNIILDPIFIFCFNLGIKGAALATIIGQIISSILCVLYFIKPKLIKLNKDSFKIEKSILTRLLKLGMSSFITQISIAIISIVANNVIGIIGGIHATDAGGALGIVFKVFAIVIAFSIGVSVGGQQIIGYNYGAKEYKRVLETYKLIVFINLLIGLVATVLFEACPGIIVKLFGGYATDLVFYQKYAILSFRIYLGGILFCCIQKSSCIFLQSVEKPYKAMILSLMRDVVLLVSGVCILGLCGGLYKMLWAGPLADIGAFIVTVILVSIEYKNIKKLIKKEKTVEIKETLNNRFVISIGREFGSGGKYIGEELAKRLKINCYDNDILAKVCKKYNFDIEMLKNIDEKEKSSFWYTFATNYVIDKENKLNAISFNDDLFLKQAKVIEELYNTENCVIIGRCSDYILKSQKNIISIFIYASDIKFKINRKSELENLSLEKAKRKIKKIDKERANYYNHYTQQIWGDKNNYDLCIDTSIIGIEKSIDLIENYIKNKIK